jgi:hypothetical protein
MLVAVLTQSELLPTPKKDAQLALAWGAVPRAAASALALNPASIKPPAIWLLSRAGLVRAQADDSVHSIAVMPQTYEWRHLGCITQRGHL